MNEAMSRLDVTGTVSRAGTEFTFHPLSSRTCRRSENRLEMTADLHPESCPKLWGDLAGSAAYTIIRFRNSSKPLKKSLEITRHEIRLPRTRPCIIGETTHPVPGPIPKGPHYDNPNVCGLLTRTRLGRIGLTGRILPHHYIISALDKRLLWTVSCKQSFTPGNEDVRSASSVGPGSCRSA